MPNWKKLLVSGSDASLNSLTADTYISASSFSGNLTGSLQGTSSWAIHALTASSADSFNVRNSLTASGLLYPTADGAFNLQVLQTDAAGTLSFGNVETVFDTVYNGEATTLTKGTPVYVSGSQGANPIVYRADAAIASKMPVVYVISENIASAATGRGVTLGHITGIDLTGYNPGVAVYVAEGGGWTSTRPTGSSTIIQFLGLVVKTGLGGQGLVLNPGPVVLPNLQSGSVWVGNGSNFPTAIVTSSIQNVISSSYALTASYALNGGGPGGSDFPYTGSAIISGSLQVTGSIYGQITGSLLGTASYAITASYALNGGGTTVDTGSFVTTSSFNSFTSSYNTGSFTGSFQGILTGTSSYASQALSSSYALTASYALNGGGGPGGSDFPYTGSAIISGSLQVTGSISILSGSFSITTTTSGTEFQVVDTGTKIGNLITDSHTVTGSLSVSGSITGSLFGTSSWALNAVTTSYATTASYVQNAISSSYSLTSSYLTASTIGYFGATFDGQGSTVLINTTTYFRMPRAGTINAWSIVADGTWPTSSLDVWKTGSSLSLPTSTNSIIQNKAYRPFISASRNAIRNTDLTSWTSSFNANDIFAITIISSSVATTLNFVMECNWS